MSAGNRVQTRSGGIGFVFAWSLQGVVLVSHTAIGTPPNWARKRAQWLAEKILRNRFCAGNKKTMEK
ncbi:MAG: hypothetical protein HYT37_02660 [Candidatus Sungbacteria bacterium]|nr:hypothetical protein [Candidatus Sungbacteria bacterium]